MVRILEIYGGIGCCAFIGAVATAALITADYIEDELG